MDCVVRAAQDDTAIAPSTRIEDVQDSFDRIRAFGKQLGVVPFGSNETSQRALDIFACFQALDEMLEIISRSPAELVPGPIIDVHPFDARKHLPAPSLVLGLIARNPPPHHSRRVRAQSRQVLEEEWRCRADYVPAKTDCGRALAGQQVRAHGIFEVDAAKQELIRPGVVVRVGLTRDLVVVFLREKSRGSEDDARQPLVPVEQLAKVLCRGLGDASRCSWGWA